MLATCTRLLAIALVVLVPTTFATALSAAAPGSTSGASFETAPAMAAGQAEGSGGSAPSMAVADRGAPPAHDDSRPWLRSLSTTPMRPRVPRGADAPESRYEFSWNVRLRIDEPVPGAVHPTLGTPGVRFATTIHLANLAVRSDEGRDTLRVAFVDPERFRVFTPRVTGEAEALWHGLREGGVVLTHHAARRMGVTPGARVSVAGRGADVAGAAALGSANLADAVVSARVFDPRAFEYSSTVLVGVNRLRERHAVAARLEAAGLGTVEWVRDVQPYRAELHGDHEETVEAFESFTFVNGSQRGWLRIDPGWVKRNIARGDVPIVGEVVCHRLIFPQLRAALEEVVDSGLDDLVDPDDFGGCFAPRHIGRNPHSSLSMHAWGLAIDFNVHTNMYGDEPELDPRIVEIFEGHGFNWGGHWRTPDGMHFELGVLRQAP